jgi:site-specific DNA recombinase
MLGGFRMKKIKVGIYIRVSTQEQAEAGYSIHEQEERLKKYAEINNWIVYKVYSDPGYSGAKLDRPALTEMIKDIEKGKIQKVLVYKLDRLSRRQRDTLYLIEDIFNVHKVDFVSMTEQIDTGSPLGRAMIGILATFAQLEREQIRERMQVGLDARAKEGLFHGGGYAPIGYDYIDGELIVNDYEALQVRKIYDLYLDGLPINAILNFMKKHGYTKKYADWSDSAIRSVLFSKIYTGVIEWKGQVYPGKHKPLISLEDFEKVQKLRKQRALATPKNNRNPFKRTTLLGGLIWCGNCGARYYAKQNTVKRGKTTDPNKKALQYYTCYSRAKSNKRMIKDPTCKNPSFNTQKLDAIILGEIRKLAIDKDYFNNIIEGSDIQDPEANITALKDRIKKIDQQINKLIDLYQLGNIDFNIINEKIEKLSKEKQTIEDEIDNFNDVTPNMNINEAKRIIASLPEILDNGDREQIKSVVHSLIESILIYDDAIEINWKFQ